MASMMAMTVTAMMIILMVLVLATIMMMMILSGVYAGRTTAMSDCKEVLNAY